MPVGVDPTPESAGSRYLPLQRLVRCRRPVKSLGLGRFKSVDDHSEMATLVARAAARGGIPTATLEALLTLEEQFPDFTIPGERTRFGKVVGDVLDAAVPAPTPDGAEG